MPDFCDEIYLAGMILCSDIFQEREVIEKMTPQVRLGTEHEKMD
jgi:hypothetical protein